MELRHYLSILRRWWWLAATPAVVVGGLSLATYRPPPATYGTTVRFTASLPPTLTTDPGFDPNYYSWLTSEYIVGGLSDWMRTGAFAAAVSEELAARGQGIPAGEVGASIASDYVRSQLVLYVNGADPERVRAIADAAIAVLQQRNAAAFPQLGGANAVVVALDRPNVGSSGPGLREMLDLPVRLGLGLAVGIALAFAAHYLDPFVRDRQEVEAIGLQVLGEIPRHK